MMELNSVYILMGIIFVFMFVQIFLSINKNKFNKKELLKIVITSILLFILLSTIFFGGFIFGMMFTVVAMSEFWQEIGWEIPDESGLSGTNMFNYSMMNLAKNIKKFQIDLIKINDYETQKGEE